MRLSWSEGSFQITGLDLEYSASSIRNMHIAMLIHHSGRHMHQIDATWSNLGSPARFRARQNAQYT